MGIVRGQLSGGNCLGAIARGVIVLGEKCPGGIVRGTNCPRWQLAGGQLPRGQLSGGQLSRGDYPPLLLYNRIILYIRTTVH